MENLDTIIMIAMTMLFAPAQIRSIVEKLAAKKARQAVRENLVRGRQNA